MEKILELKQKRAALVEQAGKLLGPDGKMSGETETAWQRMHDEADEIRSHIEKLEKQAKADQELKEVPEAKAPKVEDKVPVVSSTPLEGDKSDLKQRAFRHYLRYGSAGLSPEYFEAIQSRAIGDSSVTGFAVSDGFKIQIVDVMKMWTAFEKAPVTHKVTNTGLAYPYIVSDDTANTGVLIAEGTCATDVDPSFKQVTLGAYTFSSNLVTVSMQSEQDIADLENDLGRSLGIRLARVRNQYFTTGTGTNQPEGVVTHVVNSGNIITGATGETATESFNDFINLESQIDPAYRAMEDANGVPLCGYMFSDATLRNAKKLVDNQGRPLFLPSLAGLAGDTPDTINGYPYYINNYMATPAASALSMVFGYWPAYVIRDVNEVTVLRLSERFADCLQIGYLAFIRSDGRVLQSNAFAGFEQSAT